MVEFIDPVFALVTSAVLFAVWAVMVWLDRA